MERIQETDENLKMNNPDAPSDGNSNKVYNQGVRPKVKNNVYHKGSKTLQSEKAVQNGSISQTEVISGVSNGASCSSSTSLSSTSSSSSSSSSSFSSVNKTICDSYEKSNVDHLAEKCSAKGRTLSSEDNDLKFHDKKRKTGSFADNESSSGNEGDEGLSGDDYCIYTYKGDQFADLPNSFFTVDMGVNESDQLQANHRRESRPEENDRSNPGSSPEMDYLEMDFDPGPSLEQDSEEDVDGFDRKLNNYSPVTAQPNKQMDIDCENEKKANNMFVKMEISRNSEESQPGPSNYQCSPKKHSKVSESIDNKFLRTKECLQNFCEGVSVPETGQINVESDQDKNVDEIVEISENESCSLPCRILVTERLENKNSTDINGLFFTEEKENEVELVTSFEGIMLWTEQEAISKQVTMISADVSCGITAVINAMLVLKIRCSIEKVKEGISTRLKSESASIPQYLVSKSFAGVAHENLIRGIHHASHGALYARFFQMYPRRDVILSRWLCHWMKKGAVPIATMNVQRDTKPEDPALDTRHHQMIFGVSSKGIYLTDPLECIQDEELWCRLTSPSVLKIKRSEIVSRWSPSTNLKPLMFQSDDRWKKMNVLGQVVNIIRESPDPGAQGKFLTQHISIPASSGITLVIPRNSSGYEELVSTADLPLLQLPKSD